MSDRRISNEFLHVLLRQGDEVLPDSVADPARAGVEHQPDRLVLVEADLDEMIAGAEGAEVVLPIAAGEVRILVRDAFEAGAELAGNYWSEELERELIVSAEADGVRVALYTKSREEV